MSYLPYALLAALAASATALLAKVGVAGVPSNLATALRTSVALIFVWAIALVTREHTSLKTVEPRAAAFLVASGLCTGLSWLAYFKALSLAPVSRVAPIDKLSLAFTVLLAAWLLRESLSWTSALGVLLITAGALLVARG